MTTHTTRTPLRVSTRCHVDGHPADVLSVHDGDWLVELARPGERRQWPAGTEVDLDGHPAVVVDSAVGPVNLETTHLMRNEVVTRSRARLRPSGGS
ncbi:MAG: hypothetical protein S0880_10360 [Actinomycetota bacterium]|nr:hypothetical protein [Actinomycetota bacterium]